MEAFIEGESESGNSRKNSCEIHARKRTRQMRNSVPPNLLSLYLVASVGWASDSWVQLRSWSQGHNIKTCTELWALLEVLSLRLSLISLSLSNMFTLWHKVSPYKGTALHSQNVVRNRMGWAGRSRSWNVRTVCLVFCNRIERHRCF